MGKEKTYMPGQENLTASDVLKLAGLTYRQLHDWENRAGIIDSERAANESWRNFTFEEVISLAVCARLREHFALPLERTGEIYKWLLGKKTDWMQEELAKLSESRLESYRNDPTVSAILSGRVKGLNEAIKKDEGLRFLIKKYIDSIINVHSKRPVISALKMAQLGMPSYLLINQQQMVLLSEVGLMGWFGERLVEQPTLVFPLLNLFNEIHSIAKIPQFTLDQFFTSFQDYWNKLQDRPDLSESEREVLRLIRERDYQRVVAHVKGGKIIRVEREDELLTSKQLKLEEQILAAINDGDHQSVTVDKRDGEVVRISRKESIKLDKVTGRT